MSVLPNATSFIILDRNNDSTERTCGVFIRTDRLIINPE